MNLNFSKIMPQQVISEANMEGSFALSSGFFIPVLFHDYDLYRKGNLPIWRPFFLRTDLYAPIRTVFSRAKDVSCKR